MSKLVFQIEPEIDFELICISSHHKDYRLCWEINKKLNLKFARIEEYYLGQKEDPGELYTQFQYNNETEHVEMFLISNRCIPTEGAAKPEDLFPAEDRIKLIPELKPVDYLLLVYGQLSEREIEDLVKELSGLSMVHKAWKQDVSTLRSKFNLLR